jgi:hypothetical protein
MKRSLRHFLYLSSVAMVAAVLCQSVTSGAGAQDAKKYPNWEGLWRRGSSALVWDPNQPPGLGQQPPLTAEYQALYEANLAKRNGGALFDPAGVCGLGGMPRIMTLYVAMEIVIKPNVTYMLLESTNPIRRIYTDGRDWPQTLNPQSVGYSIGRWIDTGGDGTYDTLEVETRHIRGLRLFDTTGIPLHKDNETIVKERMYLDKSNPNILRNEITTFDHALTRPWSVSRFYLRDLNPVYEEYPCTEDNRWVAIGGQLYLADSEGYLMPIRKEQPPPDPKYLQKYFGPTKK